MSVTKQAWVVGMLMILLASPSMAASNAKGTAKNSATSRESPPRGAARVRFLDSGSGESKAARERRLRRECKGRPNAGACLGMTR